MNYWYELFKDLMLFRTGDYTDKFTAVILWVMLLILVTIGGWYV